MPSRMWRRPSISRKSSCAPRTPASSWGCNRNISPARCRRFPRRFRTLAKVLPKWRWMLPNPRPDCARLAPHEFSPQIPPAALKYQKFQSLNLFVQCNIFCCIAPKMCYIKSRKPRAWKCSSFSRGISSEAQQASRNQQDFKDTDHGRSHHSPQAKTSKPTTGAFEMPKFEMPKFDIPKVEMPAAFREFAERGVAQAKDTYEKMKAAAEEATDVLETTYSPAAKGTADYGLKVIGAATVNTNEGFEYAGELITAKTPSAGIWLSSAHPRNQFQTLTAPLNN